MVLSLPGPFEGMGGAMTKKRGELLMTLPTFKKEVVLQRFSLTGEQWWVRVYLGDKDYRFYKLPTTDPQEAQQLAFQKWEAVIEAKERNADNKLTITRLFWLFIQSEQELMDRGRIDEKTFISKKSGIVNGILPFIAAKRLKSPKKIKTNKDFRDYPNFRQDQGKADTTINNEIITIREAFRWMRVEDHIDFDPPLVETIPINQAKREEANPPIPVEDFEQIRKYLDVYSEEVGNGREGYMRKLFRTFCLTIANGALRPHEWRSLDWSMVRPGVENEIEIPRTCKTGARLVVFRSPVLGDWKKFQARYLEDFGPHTPLGANPTTGKTLSDQFYYKRWLEMMDVLNMDYTIYSMRATGICVRLESGVPIFTVAKWAGNSVSVIERYYTHAIMRSERMKAAVLKETGDAWERAGIEFRR